MHDCLVMGCTCVKLEHVSTGIKAYCDSEATRGENLEKAMEEIGRKIREIRIREDEP